MRVSETTILSKRMIIPADLPTDAFSFRFVRARGPGGQHVNKVSSAVELRVHLSKTELPPAIYHALIGHAGRRVNQDGDLIIHADESRSQLRNREAALARFASLLARAQEKQAKRIPTRPSRAAKARRVANKTQRGRTKQLRQKPSPE
jgi:ribosome-associated protein